MRREVWFATLGALCMAGEAAAITIDQIDTFEDGTTQGWFAGGGPLGGSPPVPPVNVSTGGPTGVGDNFLAVTATGGSGPGSRLVTMNASQWSGDFIAAGIGSISMNVINLGNSDLALRLLFEDPTGGPPTNSAVSHAAVSLAAGSGWQSVVFSILDADLDALTGSVEGALRATTLMRLFHGPDAAFPPTSVTGVLGIDNIRAHGGRPPTTPTTPVPEPSTWALGLVGLLVLTGARWRRTR